MLSDSLSEDVFFSLILKPVDGDLRSRLYLHGKPIHYCTVYPSTHIYNGGFVTDFFGALFYPSAHNVRRRIK